MSYQSINPNDGKIIKTFAQTSDIKLKPAMETQETAN